MTDAKDYAALDDEVDSILNAEEPTTTKPKKAFGLANRHENVRDTTNRRDTGFGKPSHNSLVSNPMRKKPRVNSSWECPDPVPSFEVSRVSTQRDTSVFYSTSNPMMKRGGPNKSSLRPTVPSAKVIPGKALIASEAKKHANPPPAPTPVVAPTPVYSNKVTNLMKFSRQTQPSMRGGQTSTLEACSTGKYWTPKGTVLTPPGNKHKSSRASIASTTPSTAAPTASRRRLSQIGSVDDDEVIETRHHRPVRPASDEPRRVLQRTDADGPKRVPSRVALVDDSSFFLEDKPFRSSAVKTMPSSMYNESLPRVQSFASLKKRSSGGTAEKPINLSDSEDESPRPPAKASALAGSPKAIADDDDDTSNVFELGCRYICVAGEDCLRHHKMRFTDVSMQWSTHVALYTCVARVLWARKGDPSFFVVVFKPTYTPMRLVVVQPADRSRCVKLMQRLNRDPAVVWEWQNLCEEDDFDETADYVKYKSMLPTEAEDKPPRRRAKKRDEVSPIVLTYPLPPNATDVISITQADLDRLQPMEYLNDNLVDYYFKWLMTVELPSAASFCAIVSSHFYTQLRESYTNVATWFTNLLDKDVILVPVNLQLHWSLAVVLYPKHFTTADADKPPTCIVTIDSMGSYHRKPKIVQNLKKFLVQHSGVDDSYMDRIRTEKLHGPQQANGYDCGVYMLLAAHHIIRTFQRLRNEGEAYPALHHLLAAGAFAQRDVDQTRLAMLTNLNADAVTYAALTDPRRLI